MAVPSDGSYDIPKDLIFSFPVEINNQHEWRIVQGLNIDSFAKEKLKATTDELVAERDDALAACEEAKV